MRRLTRALTALGVATVASRAAEAQTMRDYAYERPLRGEKQLRAVVEFAAGRLTLGRGNAGHLYQLDLSYDAERYEPLGRYHADAREVRLGVNSLGGGGVRVDRRRALPQVARIGFPADVDLSLDVSLGAVEGSLALGDLRISDLELRSGASRTTVGFDAPNAGSCRTASIESGAGQLEVRSAGNSGCRAWRFQGGVGEVTLDLGGAWPADAHMVLEMALGGITLVAPRDLGLRVTVGGFLSGFDAKGFTRNGKTWTSASYAGAKRRVDIEVSSAMGGVKVVWK